MDKKEYLEFYNLFDKLDERCYFIFNKLKRAELLKFGKHADYGNISWEDINIDSIYIPYIDGEYMFDSRDPEYYYIPVNIFFDDKLLDEFIQNKIQERKKDEEEKYQKYLKSETEKELKELKRLQEKYKDYNK